MLASAFDDNSVRSVAAERWRRAMATLHHGCDRGAGGSLLTRWRDPGHGRLRRHCAAVARARRQPAARAGRAYRLGALSRVCARRPDSGLRRLRYDRAPVAGSRWQRCCRPSADTPPASELAFSPDGATLATGSVDMTRAALARAERLSQSDSAWPHRFRVSPSRSRPTGRYWLQRGRMAPCGCGRSIWQQPARRQPNRLASQPRRLAELRPVPPSAWLGPVGQQPAAGARRWRSACATCHTDGPLVRSWDPTFARSPGPTTLASVPPGASTGIGVPKEPGT